MREASMTWGLMKAIIILPGTVLVLVPAVILFASRGTRFSPDIQSPTEVTFFVAMAFIAAGVYLAARVIP